MPVLGLAQTEGFAVPEHKVAEMAAEVAGALAAEFGDALLEPTPAQAEQVRRRIYGLLQSVGPRYGLRSGQVSEAAARIADQVLGYGFLEPLVQAAAEEKLNEVIVNPDGSVFAQPAGETLFWPVVVDPTGRAIWVPWGKEGNYRPYRPALLDVQVTVAKLLASVGVQASEANPIVSAKIPPSSRLPAGARVHVVVPPAAVGEYPAVNVRFYTARPVTDELLVDRWKMLSPRIAEALTRAVLDGRRIVVSGHTGVGKATLLSWLSSKIPDHERIVTAEDPAELYFDKPNRVTMEVQHGGVSGEFAVPMGALVTSAMRMTPSWLVVGEVRDGEAAHWLLRAQLSGHHGLSSIHAESAQDAVETFTLLINLSGNARYSRQALKELFARAVDLVVHIGLDPWGVRRVLTVHRVPRTLKAGNVDLRPWFRYDPDASTEDEPVWKEVEP
ncbi:MAG TPA: CpaF family protein [Thermoflexia bacterium]|nr:CpaF family protein [Thermoflexia bacterium]